MISDQTRWASRVVGLLATTVGLVLAVLSNGSSILSVSAQPQPAKAPDGQPPKPPKELEWIGAAACQLCHNFLAPEDESEYQKTLGYKFVRLWENRVWAVHDLHATSYQNLATASSKNLVQANIENNKIKVTSNRTSEVIESNLRKAKQDAKYLVATDAACLACHASVKQPITKALTEKWTTESFGYTDGVGCEMCHGHGSAFRAKHAESFPIQKKKQIAEPKKQPDGELNKQPDEEATREVPWREWPVSVKSEWGLINLRDPLVATAQCASCHIGNKDEGRFVTHEMFVAGHPPLPPLDLLAYAREQPRHWGLASEMPYFDKLVAREQAEANKDKPFLPRTSKAWTVFHYRKGESFVTRRFAESAIATLKSSITLTEQLAQAVKKQNEQLVKDGKQPNAGLDYAAFDCYACHHNLNYPSDRQTRGYEGIPGRPLFRPAPFALARIVVAYAETMAGWDPKKGIATDLDKHRKNLAESFGAQTYGNPEKISTETAKLNDWCVSILDALADVEFTRDDTRKLLAAVIDAAAKQPTNDQKVPFSQRAVADPEVAQLYAWAAETLLLELEPAGPPAVPGKGPPTPPESVLELRKRLDKVVVTRLRPHAPFHYEQKAVGGVPAPTLQSVDERLPDRMKIFNSFSGDPFRKAFMGMKVP